MISNSELINGHKYIIYHKDNDKLMNFNIGTFKGHNFKQKLIFVDVKKRETDMLNDRRYLSLYNYDLKLFENNTYICHDIEKVKQNAKKAVHNMEKRSLDKILKRLVNEHFEW
jgi:hypothetical protein